MSQYSDEEIVKLCNDPVSKERGFSILVHQYQERMYWHIRRMVNNHHDSDDLVQDVFVKVFRSLDKFKGDSKLYTWLYRIATNETLTFLKSNKRKFHQQAIPADEELFQETVINRLKADEELSEQYIQQRLKGAIQSLPEKQRAVFSLRYYDEMKYEDMSDVLKTSVGGLKASYHHAVKKIEAYLTSD